MLFRHLQSQCLVKQDLLGASVWRPKKACERAK